jgi:hypothetical protein
MLGTHAAASRAQSLQRRPPRRARCRRCSASRQPSPHPAANGCAGFRPAQHGPVAGPAVGGPQAGPRFFSGGALLPIANEMAAALCTTPHWCRTTAARPPASDAQRCHRSCLASCVCHKVAWAPLLPSHPPPHPPAACFLRAMAAHVHAHQQPDSNATRGCIARWGHQWVDCFHRGSGEAMVYSVLSCPERRQVLPWQGHMQQHEGPPGNLHTGGQPAKPCAPLHDLRPSLRWPRATFGLPSPCSGQVQCSSRVHGSS